MHWWIGAGSSSICFSLLCLVYISPVGGSWAWGEHLWRDWCEEGRKTLKKMVRSASLQTQSWTQAWEQQKFFRLALVSSNLRFLKVMWPISRYWTQNPRPGRNHRSHLLCSLNIPARWSSSFRSQWRCQHLPSLRSIHYWKGFLLDDLNPLFLWLWPLVLLMPSSCTWLHATSLFNISELCHLGHTQSLLLSSLDTHRTWLSEPTLFCLPL